LLAGILEDGIFLTLPLSEELVKKNWLLVFADPTDYSGGLAIQYATEWHKRFQVHQLEVLWVVLSTYGYLRTRPVMQSALDELRVRFPVVMDGEREIARSFGVETTPQMILLKKGKRHLEFGSESAILSAEWELQKFLRTTDPGLPLFPSFVPSTLAFTSDRRVEFGSHSFLSRWNPLEVSHLVPSDEGYRVGKFEVLQGSEFVISGNWLQDQEKIATSDAHAMMSFQCESPFFSLVAQSHSRSTEVSKIVIEVGGLPVYEAIAGDHLMMDESGQSCLKITKPRLYHVLVNLPGPRQEVVLRFVNADVAPLSLFGLRFGRPVIQKV